MATFSIIGNSLIDAEELINKRISGEFDTINNESLADDERVLAFDDTSLTADDLRSIQTQRNFSPIGIGKPLSIEIATIYIGDYKKFLGSKKDLILVSGVKSSQTFQATSRAINMKVKSVEENAYLEFSAIEDGTNIVYYTPAMDAEITWVSFELMFDNFNTELFDTLSGLFNAAAGVPVFLPAAPYLLGGSQLIKIGSQLGDAVFSGKPNLSDTLQIQFQSPVLPPTEPREFVIYNDKDIAEFSNLKVEAIDHIGRSRLRLVDKSTGAIYNGAAPYLIILLDGRKREDLTGFAATLASAAMLKKFYGADNKTGEITAALQDAMKLYNDSMYKAKGERLKEKLTKLPKDSTSYENLKNLYEAYAANIQTENFKLSDLPG